MKHKYLWMVMSLATMAALPGTEAAWRAWPICLDGMGLAPLCLPFPPIL